jgi:hypothetical protein
MLGLFTLHCHVEADIGGRTVIGAMRYEDEYVYDGRRWRFADRCLQYWYSVLADVFGRALSPQRRWLPGNPVATVLPESLQSWRAFRHRSDRATGSRPRRLASPGRTLDHRSRLSGRHNSARSRLLFVHGYYSYEDLKSDSDGVMEER